MLAGLSVAVMLMTYILPSMTYGLPMLAGVLLLIPSIEFGTGTAFTMYAAVSLLSLVIAAEKEAALFYVLVFGLYPIIKKFFERIQKPFGEYSLKFLYFNAAAAGALSLSVFVLGIPLDESGSKFIIPLLIIVGNAAFLIYDIFLTKCVGIYCGRIQPLLWRMFKIN